MNAHPQAPALRASALALVALLAACTSDDAGRGRAARTAGAADAASAPVALAPLAPRTAADSACPTRGLWHACRVEDRLERAGFLVTVVDGAVHQPGLVVSGAAYRLGAAELQLYLYADSLAAVRAAAAVDADAARPAAVEGILRPPVVIRSNNLVALLFDNNDRQRERVQLALAGGLPAA